MTDVARDLAGDIEQLAPPAPRPRLSRLVSTLAARDLCDLGSIVLLAVLAILVLATFRSYAITNDEWIQHRYGELIVAYYRSGFTDRSLFDLYNLYLYGGLFDTAAVLLSHVVPMDVFDLRHLLSATIGVGGLGAVLATARLIAGPRAGLLAGVALAVCGSWYGTMFHHTKDVPLAAAMAGAVYFLARAARDLPRPQLRHVIGFGVLTGAALGVKVLALLLVELMQIVVVGAVGFALGWSPRPGVVGFVLAVALGTAAFASVGLFVAGTLRAEATLAAANLIWLVLLFGGGIAIPLDRFGTAAQDVLQFLPSAALSDGLHQVFEGGHGYPLQDVVTLTVWAALTIPAAARWFRWE